MRNHTNRAGARTVLGAVALLLGLLTFAPAALAGPPTHLRTPAQDISGLNHACGTAVDSQGDVYASSTGESKIKVFDPAHTELTSIPDPNEPCGLAVDSHGTLLVSEKATGKVVRFVPSAYPFTGGSTYGAAEPIDSSGNARGIAVDGGSSGLYTDDALYIAKGDHIDAYTNEAQRIQLGEKTTGGTFTLTFNGQTTGSLPYNASHAEVQEALEALSTVGVGNIEVTTGNFFANDHLITFIHSLGLANVSQIEVDTSGLSGGGITRSEVNGGLAATIGSGSLTDATGVAAYTYPASYTGPKLDRPFDAHLFAADVGTDQVKVFSGPQLTGLKLRKTIAGPKAGEDFGFGSAGAYLAVDPGNGNPETQKCASIAEQACTAGHFLVYDDAHSTVDEFDATGEFLDQFTDASLADAEPTGLAVDRSAGAHDGTVYVASGSGAAAKLLAFGPLATPSRAPLSSRSFELQTAKAVATDSFGDLYVAAGAEIKVYDPAGVELTKIVDAEGAGDLAIDSTGVVYVLDWGPKNGTTEKVTYYTPSSYPPSGGTTYDRHEPSLLTQEGAKIGILRSIDVDAANDHLFVLGGLGVAIELDSAAHGSVILNSKFGSGHIPGSPLEVAADGANGNIYVSYNPGGVVVLGSTGSEVLAKIMGAGSPGGDFASHGPNPTIAIDESNGHVLVFEPVRGVAEEYDASGAFVSQFFNPQFGEFKPGQTYRVAIDNGTSSPNRGNAYIAYDEPSPGTPDLWAFGPLSYGEGPIALTGGVDGLGVGSATVHGTVDPRGFDLSECHFEYLTDAQYLSNGQTFAGAGSQPCAESLAEIGKGTGAVPVHAAIGGLDPEARYRFRLLAKNKYGESIGKAGLFGPPLLTSKSALPILFDEATLRAEVDPSGLATKYQFLYGTSEAYGQGTPVAALPAGDGFVPIQAALTGLAEGTTYHFRIVIENEAKIVEGPDQTLTTGARAEPQSCPNVEFRTGLSANLPDCRAYELVTPADTRGAQPYAAGSGSAGEQFNNWLTPPRGPGAGERLSFSSDSALPGLDGNGVLSDGYRATRASSEGLHPSKGWIGEHVGPNYAQAGGGGGSPNGTASDQLNSFWAIDPQESLEGALSEGISLRTPAGFEAMGRGSLGTDLKAESRYLSAGGAHVIFSSKAHLENQAAPAGTEAIYDRAAGGSSAEVVSLKPDGSAFAAGEDASYVASTEDGSAVVFDAGGTLYLHRGGETVEVATAPNTFGGISEDGERVFYAGGPSGDLPAALFACDIDAGPCAGSGAHPPTEIADRIDLRQRLR